MDALPALAREHLRRMSHPDAAAIEVLRSRSGHRVYRVACAGRQLVLKWFEDPASAVEIRVYRLLWDCGVPTLPVHGSTEQALLLEDIESSNIWRLAGEEDGSLARTGEAVARWYRALHRAGREMLNGSSARTSFLKEWVEEMDVVSLEAAGASLGLKGSGAWALAVGAIERLKSAFRALPQTFNYNDFALENLALSRRGEPALRAVVFDYDQFVLGPAYGDWRNVMGGLQGAAREAFREAYGPVSEAEARLDAPLSVLYALRVASRWTPPPPWARPLLEAVMNGTLERDLRLALEAA